MVSAWVLLLACSNDQKTWTTELDRQWANSPEQTLQELSKDNDPIAVLAKAQYLIETYPGTTALFCPLLKDDFLEKGVSG